MQRFGKRVSRRGGHRVRPSRCCVLAVIPAKIGYIALTLGSAVFGAIRYSNEQRNIDAKWNFQELRPRLVKDITYPAIALGSAKLVWQGEPGTPIFDLGDPV